CSAGGASAPRGPGLVPIEKNRPLPPAAAVTALPRARRGVTRRLRFMFRTTFHERKNAFRILGTAGLLILTPCLVAGCQGTDTESEPGGEASEALENGTVYTPTGIYAGIGRVVGVGACTGTLISNWAVLTAGHCVADGQPVTFTLTGGRGS